MQKEVALLDGCVGVGEVAVSDHRSSNPTGAELARIARCYLVGIWGLWVMQGCWRFLTTSRQKLPVQTPPHCRVEIGVCNHCCMRLGLGGVAAASSLNTTPPEVAVLAWPCSRAWVVQAAATSIVQSAAVGPWQLQLQHFARALLSTLQDCSLFCRIMAHQPHACTSTAKVQHSS